VQDAEIGLKKYSEGDDRPSESQNQEHVIQENRERRDQVEQQMIE